MKEDRGPELLAVIWVFNAIGILVVSLKLFTRARILKGLAWDDFFIFLSLLLIVICGCIFSYDVHLGMGKHAATIPLEQLSLTVKVNLIANPFGVMAYSFPNISVAILLNRILAPNRFRSIALVSLAVFQCTVAAISLVILFTQCTPSEALWNPTVVHTCLSPAVITGFSYFVGGLSAFTDVVLAVVPIVAFWNLHIKLKTKIGLCILMGLTLIAAICAIVKTTKLNELADLDDFTYDTVDLVIWVFIEANVIIAAACIPTLRPFVASFGTTPKGEGESFFQRFRIFSYASSGSSRDRSLQSVHMGAEHSEAGGFSTDEAANKSTDIVRTTQITT